MKLLWSAGLAMLVAVIAGAGSASAETRRMTIHSAPEIGGKCLDVPLSHFEDGIRLQTWDCINGAAQIFVYDDQSQTLKIGPLCVESWGRGNYQDPVGLGTCNGGANQHWRMTQTKNSYQIIGINNQCLGVRAGIKANGAPLDISPYCNAGPWRLWTILEAPAAAAPPSGGTQNATPAAPPVVAQTPAQAAPPPSRPASDCRTEKYTFSTVLAQSVSANSVSTGGAACLYSVAPLHPDQVQFTSASIEQQPMHGTFEQTGGFSFKYQPGPGFKGADEYGIKVCGHNESRSGCAIITYHVTVN